MNYSWKKTLYTPLALGAMILGVSQMAHANPNDALEQLIKQRQLANQPAPSATPSLTPSPVQAKPSTATQAQPKINYNFIQPRSTADSKPAGKPVTAAQALSIFRPKASSGSMRRSDADSLISSAMGFIGVAYRFGGTTPRGFDCSGFMQYVFQKTFAVNIPRTAAQQATVGSHVSRGNLQPGDMVFFKTQGPRRISHVGMYVGNDRFIHAPRTGKRIEITSLSNKYWSSKYATARRVKRHGADRFING